MDLFIQIMKTYITLLIVLTLFILGGCARLPENFERSTSFAIENPEDTEVGKNWSDAFAAHPGQSAYYLLADGHDALAARIILALKAEQTIDAQYYLLHEDKVGGIFIDALFRAADRGVRVRLLVDDMGMAGRDFQLAAIDAHPNIEVRIFNPFGRNTSRIWQFVTGFGEQTRRSHNKSFSVDNIASILGGRNIGNEYFIADPELEFYDIDVLAVGPVVRGVSGSFDQFWNSELCYPVRQLSLKKPTAEQSMELMQKFESYIAEVSDSAYAESLRNADLLQAIREDTFKFNWADGKIVADDPQKLQTDAEDTTYHLSQELAPYLQNVDKELLIVSPYFVPGKSGVAFFKSLRKRGIKVTILTNSLASTDVPIVHSGYANYRRQLLRMGVELYELNRNLSQEQRKVMKNGQVDESKSSLHAKTLVIDRSEVFIGSLNLDQLSLQQNTEIGVVLESRVIADQLGLFFDTKVNSIAFRLELRRDEDNFEYIVWNGLVDGESKTLRWEPYTSFWDRFSMNVLRLIPAESQL